MRSLFGSLAALVMLLVFGCTWVDADKCWPNTSGGFGGGGTIPIGAVGASASGDYITDPPRGPLDKGGTPNPCMASDNSSQGGKVLTPDEQAAIALQKADPIQLARAQLRTDYAAYDLKELIESKISDPSTADEATMKSLVDTYAPIAWDQAGQWLSTVDESAVPLAQVKPRYECSTKYGCTGTTTCDYDGYTQFAYCVITNCGETKCPICPSWFDLDKLIVKNWCTYSCMINHQVVGIAVTWNFALNKSVTKCLKFETPVPCEGTCQP